MDRRCRSALLDAKKSASQIVDGSVSPYDGAHQIASKLGDCYSFLGQDHELVNLLGAFSAYSDEYQEYLMDPLKTQEVDSDVLERAREFVRLAEDMELR